MNLVVIAYASARDGSPLRVVKIDTDGPSVIADQSISPSGEDLVSIIRSIADQSLVIDLTADEGAVLP